MPSPSRPCLLAVLASCKSHHAGTTSPLTASLQRNWHSGDALCCAVLCFTMGGSSSAACSTNPHTHTDTHLVLTRRGAERLPRRRLRRSGVAQCRLSIRALHSTAQHGSHNTARHTAGRRDQHEPSQGTLARLGHLPEAHTIPPPLASCTTLEGAGLHLPCRHPLVGMNRSILTLQKDESLPQKLQTCDSCPPHPAPLPWQRHPPLPTCLASAPARANHARGSSGATTVAADSRARAVSACGEGARG